MSISKVVFVLVITVIFCLSGADAPAGSEDETGKITGRVLSAATGQPLAYANVIVVGTNLGAMTLADGRFEIRGVPPGRYVVKAMMMGYKPVEQRSVVVKSGEATELSFKLDETIVLKTQEIVATGERRVAEVTASDYCVQVTSDEMEELPVDDVLESVALKAGIVRGGDNMHVRGGRGSGEQFRVQCPPEACCAEPSIRVPREPWNTEGYERVYENEFLTALDNPYSTFSIDVDAASYSNVRRFLRAGVLPPPDAVRIEELINYFTYDYPEPEGEAPFSITTEMAACPWNTRNKLIHVGLQGRRLHVGDLPPNNLVFLIDVSGSMQPPNKLPLLIEAFLLLTENLRPEDRVAIVVYASASGLVLSSTPGSEKQKIKGAIRRLRAGGSTAGGAGIKLAYKIAQENFLKEGNNRVILATDGDFNTGVSSDAEMIRLIEEKRESGVFITVLGFGEGNLKDPKMEKIADHGNGHYAYIDDIFEARKVLVNELGATLYTIAKDVKIQVEFNPARVESYRLLGYENRILKKKDFDDDKKDAGEIGAGHSVTALYEIVPADGAPVAGEELKTKYTLVSVTPDALDTPEVLTVGFRYKEPDEDVSKLLVQTLEDKNTRFEASSQDLRFAAAVAEFGMLLRGSQFKGEATFVHVLETAKESTGKDEGGYRHEFVRLVEKSRELTVGAR